MRKMKKFLPKFGKGGIIKMNKKQYNNVIDWTLKHETEAQSEDSLAVARAVCNNLGVALPQGDLSQVVEILATDDYMGWKSCTHEEAQEAVNSGIAAIGVSDEQIVVLTAMDEEDPMNFSASELALAEGNAVGLNNNMVYYLNENSSNTILPPAILPPVFSSLIENGFLSVAHIEYTNDGFYMCKKPLTYLFSGAGIYELIDDKNKPYPCSRMYDDWYLYSIYDGTNDVYSLVKMREQETDGEDDDNPGVTVCFVSFNTSILLNCLYNDTYANKIKLSVELDRVIWQNKQTHDAVLQQYFDNPASCASYSIAELYIQHIANMSMSGYVNLPNRYLNLLPIVEDYERVIEQLEGRTDSGSQLSISQCRVDLEKYGRIPNFISSLNQSAGYTVCDDEKIMINSPNSLSSFEKYAILATHTGNVSLNSFAAEVKYHAHALETWYGKWNLFDAYEKALRADMAVGSEHAFKFVDQYYDLDSDIVQEQVYYHGEK